MTPVSIANDLSLAIRLSEIADQISMKRFRASDLRIETKPDRTPVTDADIEVEAALRKTLANERPGDQIIGEEYENTDPQERSWILDPIDGTVNYLRGVPIWATLIALREKGEITVGVVSAPALQRTWWAAKGYGAHTEFADGKTKRIEVSKISKLEDSYFSYNSLQMWDQVGKLDKIVDINRKVWRTRAFGDFYSYMLLAEGAIDAVAEHDLEIYDWAALVPIIREAGGSFTGLYGDLKEDTESVLATNGLLHQAYRDSL